MQRQRGQTADSSHQSATSGSSSDAVSHPLRARTSQNSSHHHHVTELVEGYKAKEFSLVILVQNVLIYTLQSIVSETLYRIMNKEMYSLIGSLNYPNSNDS